MEKVNIRGVDFANVTKAEAAELLIGRLAKGIQTAVVTPNAEILQRCIDDKAFAEIINSAEVILPDGIGVVKAAKILKTPIKEKVPGVEIGESLFERVEKDSSFFFFGGGKGENGEKSICETAAEKMTEKYGITVAGTRHGFFEKSGAENDETVRLINESGADILYVCLGSPVQEEWVFNNRSKLTGVKLILALGGSLDIYAQVIKRAPSLFIKTGTEWLWRLLRQPSRIGRMMALPKFYFGTWIYKIKNK